MCYKNARFEFRAIPAVMIRWFDDCYRSIEDQEELHKTDYIIQKRLYTNNTVKHYCQNDETLLARFVKCVELWKEIMLQIH